MNRRDFIQVASTAGSGLILGLYLPSTNKLTGRSLPSTTFEPNAWIKVQSDNFVRIMVAKSEMCQGVVTSLPMIVADEMDLDWSKVIAEKAPADRNKYGWQMTGGSNSVSGGWKKLRKESSRSKVKFVITSNKGCLSQSSKLSPPSQRLLG